MIWKSHVFYYAICPRKYYLAYVKEIRVPPTKEMVYGNLRHHLRESISKKEQEILRNVERTYSLQEITAEYERYYKDALNYAIVENAADLDRIGIDPEEAKTMLEKDRHLYFLTRAIRAQRTMEALDIERDELAFYLSPENNYVRYKIIDKSTGFAGVLDRIVRARNEFYPIEIKTGKPPQEGVYDVHEVQACFSALLVENKFQVPTNLAFVEYAQLNERRPVLIDESLKEKVFRIKDKILKIHDGYVPSKRKKCQKCEYQGVC